MDGVKIGALMLVVLSALQILRTCQPNWTPFVRIAATVLFFGGILVSVGALLDTLNDPAFAGGNMGDIPDTLKKALGIAFLTEIASAVCRDCGETGLADLSETAGKIEILLLALPLIRAVLSFIRELLGGGL